MYENGELQFFNHPEGYIEQEQDGSFSYIYQYKDHLGNIRLSYSDTNGDGSIDFLRDNVDADGDGDNASEIREVKNYYPFGMLHNRPNGNVVNGRKHNYGYLGQEEVNDLVLNWISYRWRNGDPALGRFFNVDPIAEDYPNQSTYQFASNNPVWKIELEGLEGVETSGDDYINGLGYGIDTGDGTAVPVGSGGLLSEGYFSSALNAVGDVLGAIHDGISSTISSVVGSIMGTMTAENNISDAEFSEAVANGDENAVFAGLESGAAAAYNEVPDAVGEAGANIIEGAVVEFIGPRRAPAAKSNNTGKIYKVPGVDTDSGLPYIGRTQQASPAARGRSARDGRNRSNASVIDTYDPSKPGQGAYKEQKAIDANGGVKNLDNKRNERTSAKMAELEKKYGNGS